MNQPLHSIWHVIIALACWLNNSLEAQNLSSDQSGSPQLAEQVIHHQNIPTIDSYYPRPMLTVPVTRLTQAKFPVIDLHGHFGMRLKGDVDSLNQYVRMMDAHQIALSTSLDAVLGTEDQHLAFLKAHSDRFLVFCHIDFVGDGCLDDPRSHVCNRPGFVRDVCHLLEAAQRKGVVGLKFFKEFGLKHRHPNGSLIAIDESRFDPIWEKCAELQMPVLIHTADPAAFFEPIDPNNERFEELLRNPQWSFYGESYPARNELLAARNRLIGRHPKTQFIAAHVANNSEDLVTVAGWLDRYPNMHVEIASRIGELGRQPYSAREFFLNYQDRILFGTDGPWPEQRLTYYWRFLESWDQYFPYSEKQPQPQGLWFIYGLGLPDEVLRKVYHENACRLMPRIKQRFKEAIQAK